VAEEEDEEDEKEEQEEQEQEQQLSRRRRGDSYPARNLGKKPARPAYKSPTRKACYGGSPARLRYARRRAAKTRFNAPKPSTDVY
jgi:hypothetical protein